jgi:NAD(P)-dependent dehydrogenase (short-subunit alcohol dehydrogenase family)
MINIKGKTALITGSSRGVGQQIAIGLAKLGCNVILHGRNLKSTVNTIKLLEPYNIKVYNVFGELSDKEEVQDLIEQVKKLNISVDILYNNAAIMKDYHANYWEHSWEEWIETYKVNVIAMYDLCAAFIPDMIKNDFGRVVNLTSRIKDQPELAPYGASKWAVDKLTDDIASKLNNTNVRINHIDPGWIRTDMGGENGEHAPEDVLPGILAPALVDNDGPNGKFFSAINHDLDIDL